MKIAMRWGMAWVLAMVLAWSATAAEQVTFGGTASTAPDAAMDNGGVIHLAYSRDSKVYYRSKAPGQPWSAEEEAANGSYVAIAVDSSSNPHLVVINAGACQYVTRDGDWSAPVGIGTLWSVNFVDVAITNDDIVHVTISDSASDGDGYNELYYTNNGGGNFAALAMFRDGWFDSGMRMGNYFHTPIITARGADHHRAFHTQVVSTGAGEHDPHWTSYLTSGDVETGGHDLNPSASSTGTPQTLRNSIAVASDGKVHIAYKNTMESNQIFYTYDAATFASDLAIATGNADNSIATAPVLSVDSGDNVHLAFTNASGQLDYMVHDGTAWSAPLNLDAASVTYPVVLGVNAAQACVVYQKSDGAVQQIYMARVGPVAEVQSSAVDFGEVLVGSLSGPVPFTLTNSGSSTLTVTDISLSGSVDFSLDLAAGGNPCNGPAPVLSPGESRTFAVSFSPTTHGADAVTLTVASNDPDSPWTDVISGTGVRQFAVTLAAVPAEGGAVSGAGTFTENHAVLVQAVAAGGNGYHFVYWTEESVPVSGDADYTFVITGNRDLVANFALNTYLVRFVAGENGTVDGMAAVTHTVTHGDGCPEVMAEGATGYHFAGWIGDHGGIENPLSLASVTGPMTITATFELNSYVVTVGAGTGGTVDGVAAVTETVLHGGMAGPFEAEAAAFHHFAGWIGDHVGMANPLTLASVTGPMTVTATFELDSYLLTYLPGPNGSLTGNVVQTVVHGSDGTAVEAVPDEGYHFVDWSDLVTDNPRQDLAVTGPLAVTANFAINEYTVTFRTDGTEGATVNGVEAVTFTVAHGDDCTPVTAAAPLGYDFTGWSGGFTGMDNPVTMTNVTSDLTIIANFGKQMTVASVFTVESGQVFDPDQDFAAKPKILATFDNPVTGKPGKATAKVLTKVSAKAPQGAIDVEWTKKIRLGDMKALTAAQKAGTGAAAWLAGDPAPQAALDIDLAVSIKQGDMVIVGQPLFRAQLPPPAIADIAPGIDDAKGNATWLITGDWFGAKTPKAYREYTVPGKTEGTFVIKRQNLKVSKPTADHPSYVAHRYLDSKGKPACMDPATGESALVVLVPPAPKTGTTGDIVIDNGVGIAVIPEPVL